MKASFKLSKMALLFGVVLLITALSTISSARESLRFAHVAAIIIKETRTGKKCGKSTKPEKHLECYV